MRLVAISSTLLLLAACNNPTFSKYVVVGPNGQTLTAQGGDAVRLAVNRLMSDNSLEALPAGASVTWTAPGTITALDPASTSPSPIPAFGATPTAVFVSNPGRSADASTLDGTLFVLDVGTNASPSLTVTASVTNTSPSGNATGTIALSPTPAGDATRGAVVYGTAGADCAFCHGSSGHGSAATDFNASTNTWTIDNAQYPFPVPGLNAESGNVAADPAWTPALLAFAARSDVDNGGLTLRSPMPNWIKETYKDGGTISTQDFADIYAFMKTQTQ